MISNPYLFIIFPIFKSLSETVIVKVKRDLSILYIYHGKCALKFELVHPSNISSVH